MPEDQNAEIPDPAEDSDAPPPTNDPSDKAGAPPWGEDFDPARAWHTIQTLREREKELSRVTPLTPEQQSRLDEYDRLVEASKSDLERATEERDRWMNEATRWRTTSVSSRIEALAAPDFAYPADAVAKLNPDNYLDAGGVIDETAIKRDLAAILDERPNWRRQQDERKPRTPAPNQSQGSGGGGAPAPDPRQEFAQILTQSLNR